MIRFIPACTLAAACSFAVALSAQDTTITTKTKIDADDARLVTLTGCLQPGTASDTFILSGATILKGDEATLRKRTAIDVDDDETEARTRTKTEVEKDQDTAVGTSGEARTFELRPSADVDLSAHVGHKVEIIAAALEPAKDADDDAEITTKTETKVRREGAPDSKLKSETKAHLPRGARPRLTVISVKHMAPSCTM